MTFRYSVLIILLMLFVAPVAADVSWNIYQTGNESPYIYVVPFVDGWNDGEGVGDYFPGQSEGGYSYDMCVGMDEILYGNTTSAVPYALGQFIDLLVSYYGADYNSLTVHATETAVWLDFFNTYGSGGLVYEEHLPWYHSAPVPPWVPGLNGYHFSYGSLSPGIYRAYYRAWYTGDDPSGPTYAWGGHTDFFIIGNSTWWAWVDEMRQPPVPTPAPILPILGNLTCSLQNMTTFGTPGSNLYVPFSFEPVNLATGNYVYQYQDLFIPGRGLPLAVTRSYNSQSPLSGPFGSGWTFNYNVRLAGINGSEDVLVIREDGRTDRYNVRSNGTYSPPPGVFDILTWNADGSYTLERKDHITYLFAPTGQLMNIADTNGNTINLTYTGNNLTQVTDPSGRELTFTYDAAGRIISITDPTGRILSYTYDANDNLVRYTDPAGGEFDYTYDENHWLTSITNPRGIQSVTNTYDGDGRVISQSNALGAVTTFSYDTNNRITIETDPLGRSTQYTHNDRFWEINETDALGHSISYAYDGNGNRISATDANGHTTLFSYDANGNIIQVTDASGHSTSQTYDSKSNLLSSKDALGRQTTFNYDANSNPVRITDALGYVTTFTYDQYGQVIYTRDANGHGTTHTYDIYGNLVGITDAAGNTATLSYDLAGRQVGATDARGKTSSFSYDALDRLLSVTDPLGHSATNSYDGVGNRISVTDAMGSTTSYTYDPLNQLTQVTDPLLVGR